MDATAAELARAAGLVLGPEQRTPQDYAAVDDETVRRFAAALLPSQARRKRLSPEMARRVDDECVRRLEAVVVPRERILAMNPERWHVPE